MVFAFHEKLLFLGRTNIVLDKIEKDVNLLMSDARPFTIIPMPKCSGPSSDYDSPAS
jgi:hypothetical protein